MKLFSSFFQIHISANRDDSSFGGYPGFTLSITSPRQMLSPAGSNRVINLATSPRSFADHAASMATSPPTVVRISCPKVGVNSTSELNPIQVEVTHGTQRIKARTPALDRAVHHVSTSNVMENIQDSPDRQNQRQPRVHFKSTPNVDLMEPPGPSRPPADVARKITSNPEIFPPENELLDHSGKISTGLSCRTSNPAVYPENHVTTNPFMPNYEALPQQSGPSLKPGRVTSPTQIIPRTSGSNTSSSTLVKSGDKTIDITDFDPMKSPPEMETHLNAISNSSSYVFVESATGKAAESQPVDISDFDPISSPPSEEEHTPTIPAIPPPPPQIHRRTPRTSESRISESDQTQGASEVFLPQVTQSRTSALSDPLSPSASSAGFDPGVSGSRHGLDISAGDASSERPGSPASPDAVGIFVMSDIHLDEQMNDNET